MVKKHSALLDNVLGDLDGGNRPEIDNAARSDRENRGAGRFMARSTALAERLSGDCVEKTLHWVDPQRCRMWERHNRHYDLLNEVRCADLIEGFKSQGQQEFPAIVRRIDGDPDFEFEVICGARRHWTVSWLRANNYRNFRFLIEVRGLNDEEAFRLSDVENRDRDDICDYERAVDYVQALAAYYDGLQKNMAVRLEVSEAWLSRYLALAKLPKPIVEAYADITHIRERHARELKPLLARNQQRELVFDTARQLANEQRHGMIDGATVIKRLKAAAPPKRKLARPQSHDYHDEHGELVLRAQKKRGRGLSIEIANVTDTQRVLRACEKALQDFAANKAD